MFPCLRGGRSTVFDTVQVAQPPPPPPPPTPSTPAAPAGPKWLSPFPRVRIRGIVTALTDIYAVTGGDGNYRLLELPPGVYTVTFELSGFQTVTHDAIQLLAGQSLAVDVQLNVGGVQETLTVSGVAPLIDTRNSSLTNIQDAATLENVPVRAFPSETASCEPVFIPTNPSWPRSRRH